MSIKIINDLSKIIIENQNNNYSTFENIKSDYGVYIFQNKTSSTVLYIGEATKQTLKNRIKQNFMTLSRHKSLVASSDVWIASCIIATP